MLVKEIKMTQPKPFLKWIGGKASLAPTILQHFPPKFNQYYEPFLGGGGMYLSHLAPDPILGDHNEWLIETWRSIRDRWEQVASCLDGMPNTKEDYYRIRDGVGRLDGVEKAAAMIYLNKTCFRGLFRVNRRGRLNAAYGFYKNPIYYDRDNLEAVSKALRAGKGAALRVGDFESIVEPAQAGDFVYMDPPYHDTFSMYTASTFTESDQGRVARLCRRLHERGVRWVVSNSDTKLIRYLYEGFKFTVLETRYEINVKASGRASQELLIENSV